MKKQLALLVLSSTALLGRAAAAQDQKPEAESEASRDPQAEAGSSSERPQTADAEAAAKKEEAPKPVQAAPPTEPAKAPEPAKRKATLDLYVDLLPFRRQGALRSPRVTSGPRRSPTMASMVRRARA